jgi:hypothetical protein
METFKRTYVWKLNIVSHKAYQKSGNPTIPRSKWYTNENKGRITTGDLLNNVRTHLHARAVGMNFDDFVNKYLYCQALKMKKTSAFYHFYR